MKEAGIGPTRPAFDSGMIAILVLVLARRLLHGDVAGGAELGAMSTVPSLLVSTYQVPLGGRKTAKGLLTLTVSQ
jgi:hypothetical protein